jgi:hypothetical protein
MKRAAGFLLGCLLMLALFLLALDAGLSPTLVKEVVSNETDIAEEPEVPKGPEEPAPDGVGRPAATAAVPVEPADDSAALPVADTAGTDAAGSPEVNGGALEIDPQLWNQSMAAFETADRKEAAAVSRYLVWSPFRSEWAAQGFAQRFAASGSHRDLRNA